MQNACEGVESVAEMIARLVCEYEARQAAKAKKVHELTKSAALPELAVRSSTTKIFA